ncbi:hypothetical protein WJX72_003364 [[Myrmecia] bisecta]|uniref:Uncharacterized protein n=1 Tax=[Myrmecia] bisecta TaxID=41462 RepID=A0AAW1R5T2_9CHLO
MYGQGLLPTTQVDGTQTALHESKRVSRDAAGTWDGLLSYREFYRGFNGLLKQRNPAQVAAIRSYCSHASFADFSKPGDLPDTQLLRFIPHMEALVWLNYAFKALSCCEVASRPGVPFDWCRKHVCNRLACPISQAHLATQRASKPHIRLAFEAFAGVKLRMCSGCSQAWYCARQSARKRVFPYCLLLFIDAAALGA